MDLKEHKYTRWISSVLLIASYLFAVWILRTGAYVMWYVMWGRHAHDKDAAPFSWWASALLGVPVGLVIAGLLWIQIGYLYSKWHRGA